MRLQKPVPVLLAVFSVLLPALLPGCRETVEEQVAGVPGISGEREDSPWENNEDYLVLPGVSGPSGESPEPAHEPTQWSDYEFGTASRFAVYLKDSDSKWLGIVHGLKSIGIPFRITDSIDTALDHEVVLVYPRLRDKDIDEAEERRLRSYVFGGGTLLAVKPEGDRLDDLFGYSSTVTSRRFHEMIYTWSSYAAGFTYHEERVIRIGNPERRETFPKTLSYRGEARTLAVYDDGSPAVTRNSFGAGYAFAFGLDLGHYIKKGQSNRDEEASRSYVNDFEPSVDTVLRFLKNIYKRHSSYPVFLHSVPDGYPLSVIISHDVDYAGSLANSIEYAEYERSMGYGATYFMQTKYFKDFFDEVFFSPETAELLAGLEDLGMELGSHSVCHSDMFARVPQGSYDEQYPEYQPRIIEFYYTRDATVTGELRVSKFLIEELSESEVVSFRPGFLANPFSLPESLQSTGYRFSSAVSANDVMTHLPFRNTYRREWDMEVDIYEFPITLEDEYDPPMDQRVDQAVELAEKIARYGGLYVVLIHPDITGHKLAFLKEFTSRVRDWAWWGTHEEFGRWWAARDTVEADIVQDNGTFYLYLNALEPVSGLGLELPDGLRPAETEGIRFSGKYMLINLEPGVVRIPLAVHDGE